MPFKMPPELSKRIGPFPVWSILASIGVGIGAFIIIKRKRGAGGSDGSFADSGGPIIDPLAGGLGGSSGGSTGIPTLTPITPVIIDPNMGSTGGIGMGGGDINMGAHGLIDMGGGGIDMGAGGGIDMGAGGGMGSGGMGDPTSPQVARSEYWPKIPGIDPNGAAPYQPASGFGEPTIPTPVGGTPYSAPASGWPGGSGEWQ